MLVAVFYYLWNKLSQKSGKIKIKSQDLEYIYSRDKKKLQLEQVKPLFMTNCDTSDKKMG